MTVKEAINDLEVFQKELLESTKKYNKWIKFADISTVIISVAILSSFGTLLVNNQIVIVKVIGVALSLYILLLPLILKDKLGYERKSRDLLFLHYKVGVFISYLNDDIDLGDKNISSHGEYSEKRQEFKKEFERIVNLQ
jgi:hypothetical protein